MEFDLLSFRYGVLSNYIYKITSTKLTIKSGVKVHNCLMKGMYKQAVKRLSCKLNIQYAMKKIDWVLLKKVSPGAHTMS